MRFIRIIAVFTTLLLVSNFSFSQQGSILTLRQAINSAVEKNTSVVKLENQIEGQQSTVTAKYGSLFPTLSFSTGWTRTNQVTNGAYYFNGININLGTRRKTDTNGLDRFSVWQYQ